MSTNFQPLLQFIAGTVKLSAKDENSLSSKLTIEQFEKGNLILQQDKVCKNLKFVISGVYRVYQLKEGKEITSYFNYKERNPFVASFISLLTGKPSTEIIECIVPGELITISYQDWTNLYQISHELTTFGRKMAEYNYVLAIERIESLQYQSATDRYQIFLRHYPSLLNQIPHHYIASYLGITPESLSRIRKAAFKS